MNRTEFYQEEFCAKSSNSSCFQREPTTAVEVLMYSGAAAVVLLTVCGNLLVIISICHFKQLHTPTNLLLLSLAVADLLVGITVMPFHFIYAIQSRWCFGTVYCIFYNVASFSLAGVSIYNVAFIAVDRYVAVCNPFFYSRNITVNVTLRVISFLWCYSLIYSIIIPYFNGNITNMTENATCSEQCSAILSEISYMYSYLIFDFIIVFIVPCMTMVIMYLKMFAIAKKHANTIRCVREQHHSKDTSKMNYSAASERKAAKKLGILVSAFLLCSVPYFITAFLELYVDKPSVYLAVVHMLGLLYVNSSINPILYALLYLWFQKCVKLIVTLKICSSESSLISVL
ncbi:trace amine-associated receptor 13c-like [Megalops cyprinoides]|uniref:trace amine-associated receptor 13c-like n=1 Tax=Megalops cyprinoides TaxID=118141 RepID=UPI001864A39A|nr:trace amine-associated receptor 13c-like [Megalops cyprinoides]